MSPHHCHLPRHLPFKLTPHRKTLQPTCRSHLKSKRLLLKKSQLWRNLSESGTTKLEYVIFSWATFGFLIDFFSLHSPSYLNGFRFGIRLSTKFYTMTDLEIISDTRNVTRAITSLGFSSAKIAQEEVTSAVSFVLSRLTKIFHCTVSK